MDAHPASCLDARVSRTFIFIGVRRAGSVEDYGDTRVQTDFVHLNGLPLKPQESILVLGPNHEFVIPRHARSVRTGYLLDPAARNCYWVDATTYGSATVDEHRLGAQPLVELRDLSWIDEWFTDPPSSSKFSTVHYQLTRSKVCADVDSQCPKGARETYWTCLVGATTAGIAQCKAALNAACNDEPHRDGTP